MDVEIDMDEKTYTFSKGKKKVGSVGAWQNQDAGVFSSEAGSVDINDHPKTSSSDSINLNNFNSSSSGLSYHVHDVAFDDGNCDDGSDHDYEDEANDDYLYEEDDYLAIQSQFDNVDLPTGVEASFSWPKEHASSKINIPAPGSSTVADPSDSKRKFSVPDISDSKRKATAFGISDSNSTVAAPASSSAESSSIGEVIDDVEDGIMPRYRNFKQFDTVEDFSDHHFSRMALSDKQHPHPSGWAKRIQEEWKILEKNLPDTIHVRVYESRMELLRAVIVGPAGTPYHDGLFVFDCLFPSTYPSTPPMVYYYSGGLRLNPNLYECGKVCLSLLGTWSGHQNEMWIPGTSTMLQVLVSIQALILNAKPFFNEPGYEARYCGEEGERRSRKYNEDMFILSLKTMMYTVRRPPKYFEDYVIGHFHIHAHDILVACKAYVEGATVGSITVKNGVADIDKAERNASEGFKGSLQRMLNLLITNFNKYASIDCEVPE